MNYSYYAYCPDRPDTYLMHSLDSLFQLQQKKILHNLYRSQFQAHHQLHIRYHTKFIFIATNVRHLNSAASEVFAEIKFKIRANKQFTDFTNYINNKQYIHKDN